LGTDFRQKSFYQGSLSTPSLPRNEDYLTFATPRLPETFAESKHFGFTTYQACWSCPVSGVRLRIGCCTLLFSDNCRRSTDSYRGGAKWSNKAISASMDCFNKPRSARIISKHPPQFGNADREDGVTHNRVWPYSIKQCCFTHQLPRVLDEIAKNGEGFR